MEIQRRMEIRLFSFFKYHNYILKVTLMLYYSDALDDLPT